MHAQLDEKIKQAKLTKTETRVAEYVSNNYLNVCFMTALDLGDKLKTSDTSVIRTARKLGFKGFSDMQDFIKSTAQDELERRGGVNFLPPAARYENKVSMMLADNLYEQMLKKANENIRSVFKRNTASAFHQASRIILTAKRKFVMGFRGCSGVAELLGGSLGDMFSDVRTITHADSRAIEAILDITRDDCLLIVSYPRYAEMAAIVIEIAKKSGAKIIVLSDKITAPVNRQADVVLLAEIDSVTLNNSYVAPTLAAEMLLATVYRNIGEEEKERLKELEHYIAKNGLY